MPDAYLGLGSNLQQPYQQIQRAIELLAELPDTTLIASASIYQSPALSDASHPDYLNTVVRIETTLAPLELLDHLQGIEQQRGRKRTPGLRWEPRTIDIDILLYGREAIQHPRLIVPHAEMLKRNFVMIPLLEIAPTGMEIPGSVALGKIAEQWQGQHLEKFAEPIPV